MGRLAADLKADRLTGVLARPVPEEAEDDFLGARLVASGSVVPPFGLSKGFPHSKQNLLLSKFFAPQ